MNKTLLVAMFLGLMPTIAQANDAIGFLLMDRNHVATQSEQEPETGNTLSATVARYAVQHGVSPAFANAVAHVESRHRCSAIGRAGERGIMQVKPATARSVGITGNLLDCSTGIQAGLRYLRLAIDRAGGENCVAASLYNRGIYAGLSCTGYGRKVIGLAGL